MRSDPDRERVIPISEVVRQLAALAVAEGDVLLVHASFRAVGPIENGPAGLIEALNRAVGTEGTVVMPSWSDDTDRPFDPEASEAAHDLGVVARTFWKLPGVQRAAHAQAFAARGPLSTRVLADPLPLPPHIPASPVGRVHDLGGKVLLIGVNHDANSTIHLAEVLARVPYGVRRSCTVLVDGRTIRLEYRENDHCCARFRLADEWLRRAGHQAEGRVGHAHARLVSSRGVVSEVVPRLEADPLLFLHGPGEGCTECDEARASLVA